MTGLVARWRDLRARASADEGFTLVELMVAMSVFAVLMVMTSTAMLSGFGDVRRMTDRAEKQATAQGVSENVTRMLRYAVVPTGMENAIDLASPTSITFYTSSGFARMNDVPNRVHIWFDPIDSDGTGPDGPKVLYSVVTPAFDPDVNLWTWPTPTAAETRTLMRWDKATSPVRFSVRVRCISPPCNIVRPANGDVTPLVEGGITLDPGETIDSVVVSVGDAADPTHRLTQQVRLPNLAVS